MSELHKLKVTRKKKIKMIRVVINEIGDKQQKKLTKRQTWILEKLNTADKPLVRLLQKKSKNINQRHVIGTGPTDSKSIIIFN